MIGTVKYIKGDTRVQCIPDTPDYTVHPLVSKHKTLMKKIDTTLEEWKTVLNLRSNIAGAVELFDT